MRILLVGEYSRLHNSLKEGLTKLGHEVLLIGNSDGFKNYDVDINIDAKVFKKSYLKIFVVGLYKLTGINLISLENAYRFYKILPKLKGFDVVQLYNESVVKSYTKLEIFIVKRLQKNNKHMFLLSCGIDYISVRYAAEKKFRYSILTPYHNDKTLQSYYKFILQKLKQPHKKLHQFLFKNVNGVISSDIDYHLPLLGNEKYLGLIPNPINTEILQYKPLEIKDKIIIFHGVNRSNYIKKGNAFFDDAITHIKEKYAEKIEVVRVENIPYKKYINLYNSCHILLDQVYAYDQGYNALEAMAKGKVVFTGAEKEWLDFYNLQEDTVAINAFPDARKIAGKLEWLILNPKEIVKISVNARLFIEQKHHYEKVAKKYVETWKSTFL